MDLKVIPVDKPAEMNVIIGQAHFIKTVEDLHEALVGSTATLRFGLAFCEASGPRLVRRSGNDERLVELAASNAMTIGAGHSFIVLMEDGYPLNVLNAVKQVPEVCSVFCATANPVQLIIAETESGRAILGAVDGSMPTAIETDDDVTSRQDLLRDLGYKL